MITLTERGLIINALVSKREIPSGCIGPGDPKTRRFLFEENPLKANIEVAYCLPENRMPGTICNVCILYRATEVTKGKPIADIKTKAGL